MYNALHHTESHYPPEYTHSQEQEYIWQSAQEYIGAYSTSSSPPISPGDLYLNLDSPPMQLPPATPFLRSPPLPHLDLAFDLPLAESCLLSWEVPETCSSLLHQKPHAPVSHHELHDESSHDTAQQHFWGRRCAGSSLLTDQSWSNGQRSTDQEELLPSSPCSPSPKLEGPSSKKKLKGVKTKSTKQPAKPKPREPKKKKSANTLKPVASLEWSSDGIAEIDASDKHQHTNRRGYGSKNLVSERKRRVKLNEKLFSLRALVPRISKMDKASIVADAIDYVKDLHKQLNSIQDDILALQARTYITTPEGLHVHEQPRKQVDTGPQHTIIEMHVSNVEPENIYHLRIHCKREQGVFLQLAMALEALNLKIVNANLTTILDLVINTIIVKVDKVWTVEDLREQLKKTFPMYGLHF